MQSNEKPENFNAGIHSDDYENEYLQSRFDASQLVNITGRKTESLSGEWRFAADLYDTCRRQGWFRQERFNAQGRKLPLDFDWESFEKITPHAGIYKNLNYSILKVSAFIPEIFNMFRRKKENVCCCVLKERHTGLLFY